MSAKISIYIGAATLANALAAGDLGFEVTFFYVTSANLAPKSCFLGYFWIFVNFAVLSNFRKMAISRDLGRVRRRAWAHFEAEIRGFRLI